MKMANYYVYGISVGGVVHYIGKGKGQRMHYHRWFANDAIGRQAAGLRPRKRMSFFYKKLIDAIIGGFLVEEIVIARGLTEEEALERELFEVANRDHLWNTSPGGDGKTSEQGKADWARDDGTRRAAASARSKAVWDDPVRRAKLTEALKAAAANSDYATRAAAISKSHDCDRIRKAKGDVARARAKQIILKIITTEPGLTIGEISQRVERSNGAVRNALCRLHKRGLIEQRGKQSKRGAKRTDLVGGRWYLTNVTELVA